MLYRPESIYVILHSMRINFSDIYATDRINILETQDCQRRWDYRSKQGFHHQQGRCS